jgi:hypothetical protein
MRWWSNDKSFKVGMIVCKNAPQEQAKHALTQRSTERGDIAPQAQPWVLRKRRDRFTAIDQIAWIPIVVVDRMDARPAFRRGRQLVAGN